MSGVPQAVRAPVNERFVHPWLRTVSPSKTMFYNVLHKSTVAVLVAFTVYGAFEVGRGTYYVVTKARSGHAAGPLAADPIEDSNKSS